MDDVRSAEEDLREAATSHPLFNHLKEHERVAQVVVKRGSDDPKFLFIGEAPGKWENIRGRPFIGASGRLLDRWMDRLGLEEDEYAVINVVPILPLDDSGDLRKPTRKEIDYFRPYTGKIIDALDPDFIVLLGRSAESFYDLGDKMQPGEWRGDKFFIYHPAYYLRGGRERIKESYEVIEKLIE